MMTLLFIALMFAVFGKITVIAIKAAWGLTKVIFSIVFLPAILIGLALAGFIYVAVICLVIAGIAMLISTAVA